jgi:hypothetical protein
MVATLKNYNYWRIIMKKIYYKVTTGDLKSIVLYYDTRLSTQYKLNEFVSSPIPETPLSVFDTLDSAKGFCRPRVTRYKIFKCEIKHRLKTPWIPHFMYHSETKLKDLLNRIKNKKKYLDMVWTILPMGTVSCKQVKLLEEVL